jgi:hypothetical protein
MFVGKDTHQAAEGKARASKGKTHRERARSADLPNACIRQIGVPELVSLA